MKWILILALAMVLVYMVACTRKSAKQEPPLQVPPSKEQQSQTIDTMNLSSKVFTESIVFIRKENGDVKVAFMQHAAIFTINKDNENFKKIYEILETALEKNKPVRVNVSGTKILSAEIHN